MTRKSPRGKNIYLRKDGRWEGRLPIGRVNGKTVFTYIYAASYEEAVKKLTKLSLKQDEADSRQFGNSFRNIAIEWINLQKPRLKPASLSSYTNIIDAYLIPKFGDRYISEIKRSEFTTFIYSLLECKESGQKGLSASTVHTILTVSKNILRYASWEKGLTVPDICGIPIKKAKSEPPFLSKAEQSILLCWLYNHLSPCNLGILLSLYTGIRLGELCARNGKIFPKKISLSWSIRPCSGYRGGKKIVQRLWYSLRKAALPSVRFQLCQKSGCFLKLTGKKMKHICSPARRTAI